MNRKVLFILLSIVLTLVGCAQGQAEASPPEIRYGEDMCLECNMIISDARFACGYAHEIAPGRYESLAFDDIGDMLNYVDKHPEHTIVAWYVHDYTTETWLDATAAHFVHSNELHSPMGYGIAAHATAEAAQEMAAAMHGQVLTWAELMAQHEVGSMSHDHRDHAPEHKSSN
jgi:copper chaperone NosL